MGILKPRIKTSKKTHKKGGANCGPNGCPISPFSTEQINKFGGSVSSLPGPFIGQPWGDNVDSWPGVQNITGDRNYLASYSDILSNDPSRQMVLSNSTPIKGGSKTKKHTKTKHTKKHKHKGGGELGNLVNNLTFELKSSYNTLKGYELPTNPLPFVEQL